MSKANDGGPMPCWPKGAGTMSEQQSLMPAERASVPAALPTDPLQLIAQVAADPSCDVEKMKALVEMRREINQEQAKGAFYAALASVQTKVPQISKNKEIRDKHGNLRSRYANIDTIHETLKPLLDAEGFALSFDSEKVGEKQHKLSCTLSHIGGHHITNHLVVPLDEAGFKSDVQKVNSTVSVGRRQLIKMHFNIIEKDEDDDGSGQSSEVISVQQALDIEAMIGECGDGAMGRFKNWLETRHRVKSISDIPVSIHDAVVKKVKATRDAQ